MNSINMNPYLSWGEAPPSKANKASIKERTLSIASIAFHTFTITLATSTLTHIILVAAIGLNPPIIAPIVAIVALATIALYLSKVLKTSVSIESSDVLPKGPAIDDDSDYDHEANKVDLMKEIPLAKAKDAINNTFKADLAIFHEGPEGWEMKKALINSATQSIECSFNFAGGAYFRELLTIVEDRMKKYPDLKVHLLFENIMIEKEDIQKIEDLKINYSQQLFYLMAKKQNSPDSSLVATEENHAKLLLVDGKYFMMGSTGVHESWGGEPIAPDADPSDFRAALPVARHEDTDIAGISGDDNIAYLMRYEFFRLYTIWKKRLNSPIAADEGKYFHVDADKANCPELKNQNLHVDASVKFLVCGPEQRGNNPIENTYETMIKSAKKTIVIANLAFYLSDKLRNAIKNSKVPKIGHFEGVGEKSITTSYFSKAIIYTQNSKDYHLMDRVYFWNHPYSLYHRKVMITDTSSIIGSFNLGVKSINYDYECALQIVDNIAVANALLEGIQDNANQTGPMQVKEGTNVGSFVVRNLLSEVIG